MSNTVTTWSAISDEQADSFGRPLSLPTEDNSNRVITGTLSMIGSQEVGGSTTHRISSADLQPSSGGILGTVQNNAGFPTSNITPESTVELPGMGRTSVKVAEHLGYLTRSHDGRYMEATQQPQQEAQQPAKDGQQSQDGAELFPAKQEAEYSAMIADVPQGVYDSMMGTAAAVIGEGGDEEAIAGKLAPRLASAMGMEPAVAAQLVKQGAAMWQSQADSKLQALGIDPSEFYEWAQGNRKNDLQQAVIQHIMGRSTKGYEALADQYLLDTLPSVETLKAHGIPTKTQGGATMVQLKGSWMSLESAVKARLL